MLITRYQDAIQTARGKVTNSLTHVRLYLYCELQITTGTTRHAYGFNSGTNIREVSDYFLVGFTASMPLSHFFKAKE